MDMVEKRACPELLSNEEQKSLLLEAEAIWDGLQKNDLGGYSGINRPFWILYHLKAAIEKYGRRDIGLTWSKDDLDAALKEHEEKV